MKTLTKAEREAHWAKTSKLMWIQMALWVFFSFIIHFFAVPLNRWHVFGFPVGFYMASQGALIAFVIMCFWNAKAQERIDEEFGVSDE